MWDFRDQMQLGEYYQADVTYGCLSLLTLLLLLGRINIICTELPMFVICVCPLDTALTVLGCKLGWEQAIMY